MSQSICHIYLHIVFSTKNRTPYLKDKALRARLYSYMVGINNKLGTHTRIINGVEDHIHILCLQPKTVCIAAHIRTLKANSSTWMKRQGKDYSTFAWQGGYGVFSVSESGLEKVQRYISNQEKHHQKKTFMQEYREILHTHDIDYDERYLWG